MADYIATFGNIVGTSGIDTLTADYSQSNFNGAGIHLGFRGENSIRRRDTGLPILAYSSIEVLNVTGTNFNDVLVGSFGNDTFYGLLGNDELYGGYGDDFLNGGDGNDYLDGGDGNDYLDGADDNDTILGGNGNDIVLGNYGNDALGGGGGDDTIMGGEGDDTLRGGDGNDYLDGGAGTDTLDGGNGNDTIVAGVGDRIFDKVGANTFIATEAALIEGSFESKLQADYSQYSQGIRFGEYANNGYLQIATFDNRNTLITYDRAIGNFDITGTQYNDVFTETSRYITAFGNDGDDIFNINFGSVRGGVGLDTLNANYQISSTGYGVHLGYLGENTIRRRDNGAVILDFNSIEQFNLAGTDYNDVLVGLNGNDSFDGGYGDDILEGSTGDDTLDGSYGNDSLNGGAGNDRLLAINGSDIVKGGDGDDYLYAVANVEGAVKTLNGGAGADRFILDMKGEVTLGFDFNTATLGNFVNAVTAPVNKSPDWERLGIDLAFDAFGAALGSIPIAGSGLNFLVSVGKTGYGIYADQNKLQANIQEASTRALEAAKHYLAADWGKVFVQGSRDLVQIDDFQIGIDTIALPKLPTIVNAEGKLIIDPHFGYEITGGSQGGKDGVFISIYQNQNPTLQPTQKVAFIANNYKDIGIDPQQFEGIIKNLLVNNQIGKFAKTPVIGVDNPTGFQEIFDLTKSSYANDNIDAKGGVDLVFGYYGDDVILGGDGNDTLYGGSNSPSPLDSVYANDGNDFINGGTGNDNLYGGSGDDFINGEAGNDKLYGGRGNDILLGGTGGDRFVLQNSLTVKEFDRILDFKASEGDKIQLTGNASNYILGTNNTGNVVFTDNYLGIKTSDTNAYGTNAVDTFIYYSSDTSFSNPIAVITDVSNLSLNSNAFVFG
jgi:Ca2+-binding RTX toxin-like protein